MLRMKSEGLSVSVIIATSKPIGEPPKRQLVAVFGEREHFARSIRHIAGWFVHAWFLALGPLRDPRLAGNNDSQGEQHVRAPRCACKLSIGVYAVA